MTEPVDMILPPSREMRAGNQPLHARTHGLLAALEERLVKLEQQQKNFSHALTADTLMGRLLTGEFEQRIEALERTILKGGNSP